MALYGNMAQYVVPALVKQEPQGTSSHSTSQTQIMQLLCQFCHLQRARMPHGIILKAMRTRALHQLSKRPPTAQPFLVHSLSRS